MSPRPALLAAGIAGTLAVAGHGGLPPCAASEMHANAVRVFAPATAADSGRRPDRTIHGASTGLCYPRDVAVDRRGFLYVLDRGSINVFDPRADGDAAPRRTIVAPDGALGLGIDRKGYLYVGTERPYLDSGSVHVYRPDADGSAVPVRVLSGSATRLSHPADVAFDSRGQMYVANTDGHVAVYRADAAGNTAPVRTIAGPNTLLRRPAKLALGPGDTLFVQNTFQFSRDDPFSSGYNTVTVYAPRASGDVEPVRSIVVNGGPRTAGSALRLGSPKGIAVDGQGSVYVANLLPGAVAVYPPGISGDVKPGRMLSSGNTSPWMTGTGPAGQTGAFPMGITVSSRGDLYVSSWAAPYWDRWWWRNREWSKHWRLPADSE